MDTSLKTFDIIIIGGSYAGLQAAMTLGRALRSVLIIDDGNPCNKQTPHSHNFLTRDGETPEKLAAIARQQLKNYETVELLNDRVDEALKSNGDFIVTTLAGKQFTARKLLFTTGIHDKMPLVPGFAECWGISVIHCPYCHGYEVRNKATGILANGNDAFEFARLINNWTNDLTLFTNGESTLTAKQQTLLSSRNITVVSDELQEVIHENGQLKQLIFKHGNSATLDALYARLPFNQRCNLPVTLGCQLTDNGFIKVNEFGQTSVEGIFAAGDNSSMFRSVANAVAMGSVAGAFINKELINESF